MHKMYKKKFYNKNNTNKLVTIKYVYESMRQMVNVSYLPLYLEVVEHFFKKYGEYTADVSEFIESVRRSTISVGDYTLYICNLLMTKYYITRLTDEMMIFTYNTIKSSNDGDAMTVLIWIRTLRHVLLNAKTTKIYDDFNESYSDTDSIEQTT